VHGSHPRIEQHTQLALNEKQGGSERGREMCSPDPTTIQCPFSCPNPTTHACRHFFVHSWSRESNGARAVEQRPCITRVSLQATPPCLPPPPAVFAVTLLEGTGSRPVWLFFLHGEKISIYQEEKCSGSSSSSFYCSRIDVCPSRLFFFLE
jgi:hypothetical protein